MDIFTKSREYFDALISNHFTWLKDVTIKLVYDVDEGHMASCSQVRHDRSVVFYLIELNIELIKSECELKNILAHELIHVAQYDSGRLCRRSGVHQWEGEYMGFEAEMAKDSYELYRALPWEEEAFRCSPEIVAKVWR